MTYSDQTERLLRAVMEMKAEIIGLRHELAHRHELARIRQQTEDEKIGFGPGWMMMIACVAIWVCIFIMAVVR